MGEIFFNVFFISYTQLMLFYYLIKNAANEGSLHF